MTDNKKVIFDQVIESLTRLNSALNDELMRDSSDEASDESCKIFFQSSIIVSQKVSDERRKLSTKLLRIIGDLGELSDEIDELKKSSKLVHDFYKAGTKLYDFANEIT